MTSKAVSRSCEDIDEATLSYAEIKAVATGNPLIREKMEIDNDVQRLKLLKASYDNQRYGLQDNFMIKYPKLIKTATEKLANVREDVKARDKELIDNPEFAITIGKATYTERVDGGTMMLEAISKCKTGETTAIGKFHGLELLVEKNFLGMEDNITQHYPHQIAVFKERIEGFSADMEKYAKNKPEDKEQFFMQVGGKPYTDKKEAGTAIIAMCKEIKGINASADVGEYLGFKVNVTFDSFNNKFVMNVKGAMSHPMEVGSDPLGNITRINNVLEAMPAQLEEAQTKLSNVEHQLETAKAEVDKPFPQEAELYEKLERLAELNALLNMDEKGDDAIGMDDEATEPEKPHEDVKSVDEKGDEVADMPIKQSNFAKTAPEEERRLADRPAERTSLQEKLAAMKARVSGTPAGRDAADKAKKKEEIL